MTHNGTRLIEQVTGLFLVLVGIAFLVLLVVLKHGGQLAGDLKVSAFMLGSSAVLIWTGRLFLKTVNAEEPKPMRLNNSILLLLRLRPVVEWLAAMGCVLLVCRIVSALRGVTWPPEPFFEALLVGPIGIGLFALRILVPGAFQAGIFSKDVIQTWSPEVLRVVNVLLRVGWLGYFAVPVAWPDMAAHIPAQWRGAGSVVACSLISVLYASQLVIIHFGEMRRPE